MAFLIRFVVGVEVEVWAVWFVRGLVLRVWVEEVGGLRDGDCVYVDYSQRWACAKHGYVLELLVGFGIERVRRIGFCGWKMRVLVDGWDVRRAGKGVTACTRFS